MAAVEHLYRYARASAVTDVGGKPLLSLSASVDERAEPCFFRGRLRYPRETAQCLRVISQVVLTRFFTPPAMLNRILLEADPVVTASRTSLRFEGFSACCSAYARLDLDPAALDIDDIAPGTTNVDFQAPMRAALAKVRDTTPMALSVGAESVEVATDAGTVVERKVPLPVRWIKGMGEVQAQLARMEHRLSVPRVEAIRFLRQLPRSNTRHTAWAVASGRGIRLTQRETAGSVRVSGVERLRAIENVALLSNEMRVYAEDKSGSSAWVLDLETQRFVFVMSPTRWRGFSGEGQLLEALSQDQAAKVLGRVQAALNWQDRVDAAQLADDLKLEPTAVDQALATLAARGLVGYDLDSGSYFHRVLPFDLSAVEALHPRLVDAQKLVDTGGIEVGQDGATMVVTVPSNDVTYQVRLGADEATCTCPWYAKHGSDRGPCKHVLAAQMAVEADES